MTALVHQGDDAGPTIEDFELLADALTDHFPPNPEGGCICEASEPDEFGNRDHIVNPDCPYCAGPDA